MQTKARNKTVFVGMSGGVDSSVAVGLLKQQGYDVIGVHLRCFNLDGCADRDLEDARRAAEVLGIPFYVFDFEREYKKEVMQYMIDGYKKGITPNPDVMCNQEIKFGLFLDKALEMGADYVATGHYVKMRSNYLSTGTGVASFQRRSAPAIFSLRNQNRAFRSSEVCRTTNNSRLHYSLYVAADKNKDQSYFLWTLTQKQLKHCLFPLGDLKKPEVRKLARKFGLLNADKKDSQGICFLGKVGLEDFLKKYIKPKKGNIIDTSGNILGKHEGVFYYTIGQRHGLHLSAVAKSPDSAPYYVAEKILKTNTLVVAQGENNPALFRKEVVLADVNLISPELIIKNHKVRIPVVARVRYRQPLVPALFVISNSLFKLVFSKPVKFVARGQSAVIYLPIRSRAKEGSKFIEMLGGGVIC